MEGARNNHQSVSYTGRLPDLKTRAPVLPNPLEPVKTNQTKPNQSRSKPTKPKAASKKPKPVPAKSQEKKRKPVSESSEAPPLAKRAKRGKVFYRRRTVRVLSSRETDTGKFPPTTRCARKREYLHYPTKTAGREDSTSLYAELGLYGSDTESDEEMPSVVRSGAQDEGQAGPDPGTLDEGQAGPDPGTLDEGQAGPNPIEINDPSSQPQPEHMDEGFTAAAYPDVQKNLKLPVDEQVIPEEPVSSTTSRQGL
ncbi:hypothetical protein Tco_1399943 [Tanacetum coccineum]